MPDGPTPAPARDWIAVDQLLQRLLSTAPDDLERAAIQRAADHCGGPDPQVPGGGPDWRDALTAAREHLHATHAHNADALTDLSGLVAQFSLGDAERTRLVAEVADLLIRHRAQARAAERHAVADWLEARAHHLTADPTTAHDTGSALLAAADTLRRTPDLHP